MSNRIDVGDEVSVNINSAMITVCASATVEHIPVATGDSWVFKDSRTGQIHYVSEGCTISKLEPGERQ